MSGEGAAACCCLLAVPAIIAIAMSFSTIHATEWGLDYNSITMHVDNEPKDAGLHFLGLGHSFVRFPNTYQNMQFSTGDHDLLHTRTSDGLPLTLGVSFQYTLIREELFNLYSRFRDTYQTILFNVATNVIAETACNYTAYNFFNDKQSIAIAMQQNLNALVTKNLHMTVETLQIILVELPKDFEDAILQSISVKQEITKTQKDMSSNIVRFSTELMAAQQSANQTITAAKGRAQQIHAQQTANAQALSQTVQAETASYSALKEQLGLSAEELMEYVYWDSITDTAGDAEFIVGIDPGVMLQT